MIVGKVGCFWFGLVAAAYGSVVSVGGGRVLSKVFRVGVYGLGWLVWHIVQLVWFDGGKILVRLHAYDLSWLAWRMVLLVWLGVDGF